MMYSSGEPSVGPQREVALAHGWIVKKSIHGRKGNHWARRYLVLHVDKDGAFLGYYKTAEDAIGESTLKMRKHLRGTIKLDDATVADKIVAASPFLRDLPPTEPMRVAFSISFRKRSGASGSSYSAASSATTSARNGWSRSTPRPPRCSR